MSSRPRALLHKGEKLLDLLEPAHVTSPALDPAEAFHFAYGLLDSVLAAAADGDRNSFAQQGFGDGAADSAGRSGDYGGLALQILTHS